LTTNPTYHNIRHMKRRTMFFWTNAGRNDPCPCGSGHKFKKCCLDKPYTPSPELEEDLATGQKLVSEFNEKHPSFAAPPEPPEPPKTRFKNTILALSIIGGAFLAQPPPQPKCRNTNIFS